MPERVRRAPRGKPQDASPVGGLSNIGMRVRVPDRKRSAGGPTSALAGGRRAGATRPVRAGLRLGLMNRSRFQRGAQRGPSPESRSSRAIAPTTLFRFRTRSLRRRRPRRGYLSRRLARASRRVELVSARFKESRRNLDRPRARSVFSPRF